MANTRISNLTASASNLAAADVLPVVQTTGVGPVKMTGTQIKTGIIGAGSVSIASGKTFTASNTLTLAGTDSTTMTFPSTSATIARTDAGNTFTGNQTITDVANPVFPTLQVTGGSNITGSTLSGVQITGTTGQFSCNAAALSVGQLLTISGTFGGTGSITSYSNPKTYRISATNGSTTFTLEDDFGGPAGPVLTTSAGTPTGLTYTLTSPAIDLSQTWNNSSVAFAGIRYTVTDTNSRTNSVLMDLRTGTTSRFRINKDGSFNFNNTGSYGPVIKSASGGGAGIGIYLGTTPSCFADIGIASGNGEVVIGRGASLSFTAGSAESNLGNLLLRRAAAATLQLGAADAAAPVAQTLQVQSVVGSTPGATDVAGANWTIKGSAGRGSGAGGSIIFQVAPAGSAGTGAQNAYATALTIASNKTVAFDAGSATAPSINFGTAGAGIYGVASNQIGVAIGAALVTSFTSSQVWNRVDNGEFIIGAFADVRLVRDAANTLALRNGTSAQRFNVYNTYTSSTNYETFKIDWITTANTCLIGTEKGSSGTARALALQTDGTTRLTIATGGDVSVANSLICNNVTNSSSTAYSDSIIFYPAGFASYFSKIKARINGSGTASTAGLVFAINAATSSANDAFWMLGNQVFAFGGDTSSFPGLKRSGSTTTLQVRLADDSAFGSFQTGGFSGGAPTIKTANYTQLEADYSLIFNGTGSITLTLLAAATYPGKILYVKTIAAQTVVSASSNVKPIDTDTAGTAILAATAGKWAMLQSDGTNWVIMAQG